MQTATPESESRTIAAAQLRQPTSFKYPSPMAWIIGFGVAVRMFDYLRNPGV